MSALEEKYIKYLNEVGVLPRLLDILKELTDIDPLPADPLTYLLNGLGCSLKSQAQMKTLERKVSRAHDELRYLRRLLIDLGGADQLYDSDTDEDDYVGAVEDAELFQGYVNPSHGPSETGALIPNESSDNEKPCCSSSLLEE